MTTAHNISLQSDYVATAIELHRPAPYSPLDRPVWSALASRQSHIAIGDQNARRFDPRFGLFAAAADTSPKSLAALGMLVPAGGAVAVLEAKPHPPIQGLEAEDHDVWQMVAEGFNDQSRKAFDIVLLTEADAAQMLALAALARPGPFFANTHELGTFVGIKRDGELIAMAGERMKIDGFTEVSGVCTSAAYRGLGYGGALARCVAERILERGEIPFLHAYSHNVGAIALYKNIGFHLRKKMHMQIIKRS